MVMFQRVQRRVLPAMLLFGLGSHTAAAEAPHMVKDINTRLRPAQPSFPVAFGGGVLFAAYGGGSGIELWRSDGTVAGTTLVLDICPGPCSSSPSWLTNVNGVVYF